MIKVKWGRYRFVASARAISFRRDLSIGERMFRYLTPWTDSLLTTAVDWLVNEIQAHEARDPRPMTCPRCAELDAFCDNENRREADDSDD